MLSQQPKKCLRDPVLSVWHSPLGWDEAGIVAAVREGNPEFTWAVVQLADPFPGLWEWQVGALKSGIPSSSFLCGSASIGGHC